MSASLRVRLAATAEPGRTTTPHARSHGPAANRSTGGTGSRTVGPDSEGPVHQGRVGTVLWFTVRASASLGGRGQPHSTFLRAIHEMCMSAGQQGRHWAALALRGDNGAVGVWVSLPAEMPVLRGEGSHGRTSTLAFGPCRAPTCAVRAPPRRGRASTRISQAQTAPRPGFFGTDIRGRPTDPGNNAGTRAEVSGDASTPVAAVSALSPPRRAHQPRTRSRGAPGGWASPSCDGGAGGRESPRQRRGALSGWAAGLQRPGRPAQGREAAAA